LPFFFAFFHFVFSPWGVVGPKDLATSKDALKFLDSFELVVEKEKK
jgi:hypothetical protein